MSQFLTRMCGFAYIYVRKYKRYIIKKRGTFLTSTQWKIKKIGLKNDALTNIEKVHDVVWNISSTVESGSGFTFQSHESEKNCTCIVFVYVYLAKETHLKVLYKYT